MRKQKHILFGICILLSYENPEEKCDRLSVILWTYMDLDSCGIKVTLKKNVCILFLSFLSMQNKAEKALYFFTLTTQNLSITTILEELTIIWL